MTKRSTALFPSLNSYGAVAGLYLLLLTALKVVEWFLWGIDAPNAFQVFVNGVVYNLVVASWVVLAVGALYLLVRLLSRRVAVVLAAVFYGLLLVAEVGLLFYVRHNGYLLGCELVARPLGETLVAIRGAVGVVLPVALPLLLAGGFVALALWRSRRPSRAVWAVPVVVSVFVLLSLCFKPSHLVYNQFGYYILNKTHYLVVDSYDYLRHPSSGEGYSERVPDYDASLVAALLASHPEWGNPVDSAYPLERPFLPDTFLNPYFLPNPDGASMPPPDIVLILVESLGHEFMGTGAMPFVDSLAATGLYWDGCLATTGRSYGAVPALTGSVGGPKSFQFGNMPAHNSLFSLLKAEGYNTRAYYCGDFSFDCVYDYLAAQRIDCLSPLYENYLAQSPKRKGFSWGYPDDSLFAYALRDLTAPSAPAAPRFSLITTLTMHDPLALPDADRCQAYNRRAEQLPLYKSSPGLARFFAACLFTDDALRRFFHGYSRNPRFNNTLFVITGDHACGYQEGDQLSFHRVPLIVWSPLLRQPARFDHTVTHNDVAPALYSLLTAKYGLPAQPTVHWLGDGLGPTPKTLLIVNYAQKISDIVYHNHYYESGDRFKEAAAYTFGPDRVLHPDNDPALLDTCRRQLALMRYLYAYTYLADRLTQHPLARHDYFLASIHRLPETVTCVSPAVAPSVVGMQEVDILPCLLMKNSAEKYKSVRVTLEASYQADGIDDMHQYPVLQFSFSGDSRHHYGEDLYRLFVDDGRIKMTKEFPLSASRPNTLSVTMHSPFSDEFWKAGTSVTLSDIVITLEYGK